MKISNSALSFDAIVFYFWLPEEELNTIFVGIHKWWFAHGLAYRRCIFYGPTIKNFRHFKNGTMDLYAIPSGLIKWGVLREFLDRQSISHNPVVSIVVEGDRLPNGKELNGASMPIQCFVADTHHMSNSINSAISYISDVGASMVFVSHSPHRKIFADCLSLNAYPLCYTPNDSSGLVFNPVGKRGAHACYYGTISDPFHPERSYILKKITSSSRESVPLDFKPRLQPREWQESLSKDIASFTCSLNGFPSVQSYAPLLCETCLITDPLSKKSELGPHLRNGENCLIYRDEEEAIDVLEFVRNKPDEVRAIARAGNSLLHRITPTFNKSLEVYCENTNKLASSLAGISHAQQKIHLNPYAITACYAYEVVQELHRLCKCLFICIRGQSKVAEYIKDYVTILPRVTVLEAAPAESSIPSPEEGECIIWIGNSESCSVSQKKSQGHSLALRISDTKDENLIGKTPGIWLNPSSMMSCDFEGRPFPQFLPKNISLFACPVNSSEVIDSKMLRHDLPRQGLFFSKVSQNPITFLEDSSVEIVSSEPVLRGPEFQNALSGLDKIPLSPQFRAEVERDLLRNEHKTLYRLKKPTVVVLIFPHGETRHFVISESGILLEPDDYWLKHFSFISKQSHGYYMNVSFSNKDIILSEEEFVWCYETANFSHFLVDALAPLAFFSKKFPDLKKLPIPQFSRTPSWQDEYMQFFGEKRFYLSSERANGQVALFVFRPKSLLMPLITTTLSRVLAVREFVRDRWENPEPIFGINRFPIYLSRNDHRVARVRNSKEIQELVSRLGGFTTDPAKLNTQQKIELFNLPGIFIAEGSGTMNVCVFSNSNARLISLIDPEALKHESFIRGGWPYFHSISDRMDCLLGKDPQMLRGSPLSSCVFDIQELNRLIDARR